MLLKIKDLWQMRFDSSFHHSWKKCIELQSLLFMRLSDESLKHLKFVHFW